MRNNNNPMLGFSVLPTSERVLALTFDDGPDAQFAPPSLPWFSGCCKHGRGQANCVRWPSSCEPLLESPTCCGCDCLGAFPRSEEYIRSNRTSYRGASTLVSTAVWGITDEQAQAISKANYEIVLWTVDSLDWSGIPGPQIVANVISDLENGAILLHHSAGNVAGIIEALPYVIEVCLRLGYRFVRLDDVGNGAVSG